jgi:hypothetical protein
VGLIDSVIQDMPRRLGTVRKGQVKHADVLPSTAFVTHTVLVWPNLGPPKGIGPFPVLTMSGSLTAGYKTCHGGWAQSERAR